MVLASDSYLIMFQAADDMRLPEPVSEPPSKIARPSPPAAAPRVAAVAPLPTASVGPALPRLFKMPPRDVANVRVTLLSNEGSGARVYAARSNPKVYDAEVLFHPFSGFFDFVSLVSVSVTGHGSNALVQPYICSIRWQEAPVITPHRRYP
jgi:hypothetical protein